MKRRATVIAAVALGAALLACVDLFHGTDFATLCDVSPNDPACDAGTDAPATADVETADADDGGPAHPDFCAWSTTEARIQALRACAWLGACEGPRGESVFGPCVVHARFAFDCAANPTLRPRGVADAFWGCLSTVKSCGDVDRCVFPGGVQTCNEIATGSSTACGAKGAGNDAVLVECSGPAGRAMGVEPCAMLGKTCVAESESTARCAGIKGVSCTLSGCSSTSIVDCTAEDTLMVDRGLDCASYGGGKCVTTSAGMPTCAPGEEAKACSADKLVTCDQGIATTCLRGRETRVNCSQLGLKCDDQGGAALHDPRAACVRAGQVLCDDTVDTCVGSVLQSCARGIKATLDCKSVGLGTCKLNANNRGSCTPP